MDYVRIGQVVNTFGIKGELKVRSFSDFDDERFAIGNKVFLNNNDEYITEIIKSYHIHKNMVLISFEGKQNINDVIEYVGYQVYILKSSRSKLEKNEYYFDELVGLSVIIDEKNIGTVIEVMDMPASPVLRVKTEEKIILIPFVAAFIEDVQLLEKKIIVNYIEGLI